jgi:hypothetical protein
MNAFERNVMINMYSLLTGFKSKGGPCHGWLSLLCKGWGVSDQWMHMTYEKFIERNFTTDRKERSDKGCTIFNCEDKR